MRNRMLVFYMSAAAGTLMGVTFLAASRVQALPLAAHYGIASAVHEADSRHNVAYVCRRDAYGRTCTYVWPSGRNGRSDRSHTSAAYPQYQAPLSQGSGYYPFYWANPQGSD
jgi:hypothetical protein